MRLGSITFQLSIYYIRYLYRKWLLVQELLKANLSPKIVA